MRGLERRQTKAERKIQKMQKEWRAEEARRKAKREELKEEEELESQDERAGDAVNGRGKKGRRGKREGDEEEDIWAAVGAKRVDDKEKEAGKGRGLVGLHDVVLAPPKFAKAPKDKFRMQGQGREIKGGVVGLKRQGELSEARRKVVEGYRALMREKSGDKTG